MLQKVYQILASKTLAIALFALICLVSIPGTFMEERDIYSSVIVRALLGLMGLNLSFCTFKRLRSLSMPVLIMHIGGILILISSLISSFGFVATVNITEGTSTDKVYRWDKNEDMPLGANLFVRKVNMEYYPVPVKVGVLKENEKAGLFELKTGDSFNIGDFRIKVDNIEFPEENLKFSIFDKGRLIGNADTFGESEPPQNFPYKFVFVAFKNPVVKRTWVDLTIDKGSGIIAEGTSEVNKPFEWNGLKFINTDLDRDKYGFRMAGIQVVKDPGKPYAYLGFCVLGIGAATYLLNRFYGLKRVEG